MIFQSELTNIDSEISQLLAQVESVKQRQSQLIELDTLTDITLGQLGDVVGKIGDYDRNAIASLKTAVLQLFTDRGNNGGNQPADPTPEPDDDESELLCLNGLTGECLTTADDEELPVDDPTGDEWVLSSEAPLTGQTCAVNPEFYWETTLPDGSTWEFASPLTCLLWEDAPMLEQYCTVTPTNNENKGTEESEIIPQLSSTEMIEESEIIPQLSSTEMIEESEIIPQLSSTEMIEESEIIPQLSSTEMIEESEIIPQLSSTEMVHTSARTGYLKLKASGQILATYAWFPRKDLAESWFDWLDGMSLGLPELRKSQRNSSWKYEIKITGLSMTQVERLASEDLSRKPSKKKETLAQAAGLEPPSGWRQPQLKENSSQLCAKILLTESEYVGQTLPVSRVSANSIGYTVTLPNGDNRWFRADMVQIVDAEIEENALPTEPEAIAFEFGDVAEVIADLNDTHLIGSFGKVKFVKDGRVALEVDEQVVLFQPNELKLKVKAQAPTQQRNHLPSADVSISDQEATYLQTNGNYKGLAKQTRQRWEQAEINPSDLIADMKTKRPAEPAWDAARYNPVLAAISSEYDF